MTAFDRRGTIRLAMAAAIATSCASRPAFAQGNFGNLIAPPPGPMLYRRTVERDMVDGAVFRVTREFTIDFSAYSGGFMVQGHQVRVAVDAPEALARFAELEERRDESGLFPIALSPLGRIQSPESRPLGTNEVEAACEQALSDFADAGLPADDQLALQRFVTAIHSAGQGIMAHLPNDLFSPVDAPRQSRRSIAIPGGGEGMVAMRFDAERDLGTGLMSVASREIVTAVEDSRRTTREEWRLTAI